ncbi:hypothetical protein HYV74_05170 [Candidatus Uhrbacteria bacterium]|nr:hypothetical protein [Candidatus Uhrbacteria bacterium]
MQRLQHLRSWIRFIGYAVSFAFALRRIRRSARLRTALLARIGIDTAP